jgi:hypothetical protein
MPQPAAWMKSKVLLRSPLTVYVRIMPGAGKVCTPGERRSSIFIQTMAFGGSRILKEVKAMKETIVSFKKKKFTSSESDIITVVGNAHGSTGEAADEHCRSKIT